MIAVSLKWQGLRNGLLGAMIDSPFEEPVRIPIGLEIDLHTYSPREVKVVLTAYLEACIEQGFTSVRVIHGKGTGALRETVWSLLAKSPFVVSFGRADEGAGSWGATFVRLVSKEQVDRDGTGPKKFH